MTQRGHSVSFVPMDTLTDHGKQEMKQTQTNVKVISKCYTTYCAGTVCRILIRAHLTFLL